MDDRDALAQALFTIRPSHRWETWEETSKGQRQWCRDKADQLIAQGWRRVGEGDVVVSRHDASQLLEWWDEQGPLPTYSPLSSEGFAIADRIRKALVQPEQADAAITPEPSDA